ncbi:helix-turn-helix domain-containing protein [Klebsiella pneumoniae]|jgi:hypothetical protein|nr:helix-turn-helix domain-containing protein [Klebsiella pneumoniae]
MASNPHAFLRCDMVMTPEVVERGSRMLATGATRQQVADVIGVNVKTLYKYLPAS